MIVRKVTIKSDVAEGWGLRVFFDDKPIDGIISEVHFNWEARRDSGDFNKIVIILEPEQLEIDIPADTTMLREIKHD